MFVQGKWHHIKKFYTEKKYISIGEGLSKTNPFFQYFSNLVTHQGDLQASKENRIHWITMFKQHKYYCMTIDKLSEPVRIIFTWGSHKKASFRKQMYEKNVLLYEILLCLNDTEFSMYVTNFQLNLTVSVIKKSS